MTETEQQQRLAVYLIAVLEFIWSRKGNSMPWATDKNKLYRYISYCYHSGKVAISKDGNQIDGVVFYWSDHKEYVEAKFECKKPQFEWMPPHPGDCLFIADCFGSRASICKIWDAVLKKFPHLVAVPMMTYRRDKLVQLSLKKLERFFR